MINKLLNELVKDCITYKLSEIEALEYIKLRQGKEISPASYNRRKAHVLSDGSINVWLYNFTRIGYVKNHQEDIACISKLRNDSMHQLQIEIDKKPRNERTIFLLKENVIETTRLLSELNLGTPIIAAIKAKLESNGNNNNTKTVQISK